MTVGYAELVEQAYQAFLGRAPEPGVVPVWVARLEAGLDLASMLRTFLESEEFRGRQAQALARELFAPPGHFYSPIVDTKSVADLFGSRALPQAPPAIAIDVDAHLHTWRRLLPFLQSQPFHDQPTPGWRYHFDNPAFAHADGCILHAMLRAARPRRMVEVGSGHSSACAIDTIDHFLDGDVAVTFIEPYPQLLEQLVGPERLARCEVLAQPVQSVAPGVFEALQADDILFIDSTHVMKTGSDVCHELFDILPRLRAGVLVHFHDVFWPFEYPADWVLQENRSWNELYGLRAFLMYNRAFGIEFFSDFFYQHCRARIETEVPAMLRHPGGSLWLRKLC